MLAPTTQGGGPPTNNGNLTPAQQREQRQRSVRFLMMFLLMLTLMDGEEVQRQQRQQAQLRSRSSTKEIPMDAATYQARQEQDAHIQATALAHPRYAKLVERNLNVDYYSEMEQWALQRPEKDEFLASIKEEDKASAKTVWHYPWNATGVYRGEWAQKTTINTTITTPFTANRTLVTPLEIESQAFRCLKNNETIGVKLLPDEVLLDAPNRTSSTEKRRSKPKTPTFLRGAVDQHEQESSFKLPLTKISGRVAFQFYARQVPAMHELSVLDGFVKLYDSNSVGYSTGRDVLLRVHGVIIHSLGRISLTSTPSLGRSAFFVVPPSSGTGLETAPIVVSKRRLQELLEDPNAKLEEIRDQGLAINSFHGDQPHDWNTEIKSLDLESEGHRQLEQAKSFDELYAANAILSERNGETFVRGYDFRSRDEQHNQTYIRNTQNSTIQTSSQVVFPFPFVLDDANNTFGNAKTPADRSMPPREQLLQVNAGDCEFEIMLNVQEEEWTILEWRKMMMRQIKELDKLDPAAEKPEKKRKKKSKRRSPEDQALVMTLNGTIVSRNCNFEADINATAIRTDWEHTTGKAINYSFYMMLTCLTQIVLLLRQLLYSQPQSASSRVSLLCIGWQTVLDALLCLVHIYLSLAIQPLFTAFASVAFFKLLIFCIIEMKYMAIIIQARNARDGGTTVDVLRRQIAMLHLRFYVALMGSFIAFFYAWENYKVIYVLALYSFWVPQIVHNAITEAKGPLHHHYVYGISLSRMVAPIYVFAVKNNFVKEIFPESTTDYLLCECLVLWVGIQAALLEAQRRYGARFFVPARFLPPKFDYNRPIPHSLLPPEHVEDNSGTPSESLQKERGTTSDACAPLVSRRPSSPRRGARNRMKGSRAVEAAPMTTETINEAPARAALPSFDCVICYNEIDTRNRSGYMLAPCDHLFHKDCLVQWMEVKMECPICRNDLPTL